MIIIFNVHPPVSIYRSTVSSGMRVIVAKVTTLVSIRSGRNLLLVVNISLFKVTQLNSVYRPIIM